MTENGRAIEVGKKDFLFADWRTILVICVFVAACVFGLIRLEGIHYAIEMITVQIFAYPLILLALSALTIRGRRIPLAVIAGAGMLFGFVLITLAWLPHHTAPPLWQSSLKTVQVFRSDGTPHKPSSYSRNFNLCCHSKVSGSTSLGLFITFIDPPEEGDHCRIVM